MQRPTCTNVRIRSTDDAHKIFYAVRRGVLPLIVKRLDAEERQALCSGCVYIWEERPANMEVTGMGIERFTEGRRWSPSRVRDCESAQHFFFWTALIAHVQYLRYAVLDTLFDAHLHPMTSLLYFEKPDKGSSPPSDVEQETAARNWDPLIKQTYSVWEYVGENDRKKLHLTAYFSQSTVDSLGTIDDIAGVGEIQVPEGLFQSTRSSKARKSDSGHVRTNTDPSRSPTSTVARTYAPFPSAYSVPHPTRHDLQTQISSSRQQESYMGHIPFAQSTAQHHADTNLSQYSIPPPLPPSNGQFTLPPIRSSPESDHESYRPSPSPPYQHSSAHGYGGRPPADSSSHRGRDSSYYAEEGQRHAGTAQPSSPAGAGPTAHRDVPPSQRVCPQSAGASGGLPSPPWYTSPMAGVSHASESQSSLAHSHHDGASYILRPTYTSTIGQGASHAMSTGIGYSYTQPSYHNRSAESPPRSCARVSPPAVLTLPRVSPPAPAPELPVPNGELSSSARSSVFGTLTDINAGVNGRLDLAPLRSLQRNHPYRRDPVDDKALRLLGPPSA